MRTPIYRQRSRHAVRSQEHSEGDEGTNILAVVGLVVASRETGGFELHDIEPIQRFPKSIKV